MNLIDVNLLVYAVNSTASQHHPVKKWLEEMTSSGAPIVFPWVTIIGFLRVATNAKALPNPLTTNQALSSLQQWLGRDHVHIVEPGPWHWQILSEMIARFNLVGNSLTDAHLAAMAIEHGWTLYSADRGFARYPNLKWVNPIPESIV